MAIVPVATLDTAPLASVAVKWNDAMPEVVPAAGTNTTSAPLPLAAIVSPAWTGVLPSAR